MSVYGLEFYRSKQNVHCEVYRIEVCFLLFLFIELVHMPLMKKVMVMDLPAWLAHMSPDHVSKSQPSDK